MTGGRVIRAAALAALLAVPAGAQQFLLPEALSPDTLDRSGLARGAPGDDWRANRAGARVRSSLEIETETARGGVLRGLDRISGETLDLPLATGEQGTLFDSLQVTLVGCRYPEGDPSSNAFAFVTVQDVQRSVPVFEGWMVASSPALNAVDHVRYDVWVLRCSNS